MSDSLQPNGLQHARLPCPSPTPRPYSNSCPLSQWCHPSNHLILYHPLLLLISVFPSIRVFSNESVLCIRWPKYWSFSFSISPSSEYSLENGIPNHFSILPWEPHQQYETNLILTNWANVTVVLTCKFLVYKRESITCNTQSKAKNVSLVLAEFSIKQLLSKDYYKTKIKWCYKKKYR